MARRREHQLQCDFKAAGQGQCVPRVNGAPAWAKQNFHDPRVTAAAPTGDAFPSLLPGFHFQEHDKALKEALTRASMTAADVATVKECLRELRRATAALGAWWRLTPFGGIANGFAMSGSDLDATCYIEGLEASDASLATQELRTQLLPLLQRHPRIEVMDQIWHARVPILKLRFDGRLDVDLSCHNTEALPNTRLLRAYADLSPQVRELGLSIKLWAKAEDVCGAPKGHLSSYALTLMAIYYMQVDPMVQMPCLPVADFGGRGTPTIGRVAWSCPLPAHVLLARFFRFYAGEFLWGTEVVSVRHGRRSEASHPAYSQLRASLSPRIHIEDPYLPGRNLHCVLGLAQEYVLYSKVCKAADDVRCGSLPAGFRRGADSWVSGGVAAEAVALAPGAARMAASLAKNADEALQDKGAGSESTATGRDDGSSGWEPANADGSSVGGPGELAAESDSRSEGVAFRAATGGARRRRTPRTAQTTRALAKGGAQRALAPSTCP